MHPELFSANRKALSKLVLLVGLLAGCAPRSNQPAARLRYDGVYVGGDFPYSCVTTKNYRATYPEIWDILRFYLDGTVIDLWRIRPPAKDVDQPKT